VNITIKHLSKRISVYECPVIELPADDIFGELKLRIEIWKAPSGEFFPRVLREDFFRLKIAYLNENKDGKWIEWSETSLFVPESMCDWEEMVAPTEEKVLLKVLSEISELFGRCIPPKPA